MKPGYCTKPLPGIVPKIVGDDGQACRRDHGGMLCIDKPWPGMLRGIWGDEERYQRAVLDNVPGMYLTGDNARRR